jgi:hypothetical protein
MPVAWIITAVALGSMAPAIHAQERAVAWVRADDGRFERELNQLADRGLRLAAITDGLPCALAVMQTPEESGAQDEYRVVRDNDLSAQLPSLLEAGFVPRLSAPGIGTRYNVVFERGPRGTTAAWRVVEFAKLEDLDPALAALGAEGYQARVLVRPPIRSWIGLSSKGVMLAARASTAGARETRVIVGSGRNVEDEAKALSAATRDGWGLDVLFTSSRDGSLTLRRERLVLVLSRDRSATPTLSGVTLERRASFGSVGSGVPVAAAAYWDEYLFAWTPRERRQTWATPIRLADASATCSSIEYRLRIDAPRTQRSTIVGAIGKPGAINGYELVLVIEERFGR